MEPLTVHGASDSGASDCGASDSGASDSGTSDSELGSNLPFVQWMSE